MSSTTGRFALARSPKAKHLSGRNKTASGDDKNPLANDKAPE